jgi:predicted  nucleic acid-binding Zn-ribbon protein
MHSSFLQRIAISWSSTSTIIVACMSFVQIQCTRCKTVFRDRAARLQDGYSRQCPGCEVVLFFAEDSQHPFTRRAMRDARRIRKEQRDAEAARVAASQPQAGPSRRFAGRARTAERSD